MLLSELVCFVIISFRMTKRAVTASSRQCTCPFCISHAGFFGMASLHPGLSPPLQPIFISLQLLAFPKAKIAIETEEICECNGHKVHQLSQCRLTADWLAPRDSDCSRTRSKVSSDWLPSYVTATWPVLEIFKTDRHFPDSPHIENCMAMILNKILLGSQQPKMIQGNKHLARLGVEAYQNSHDRDKVGLWRTGLLEPPNMTVTLRIFYCKVNLFQTSFASSRYSIYTDAGHNVEVFFLTVLPLIL